MGACFVFITFVLEVNWLQSNLIYLSIRLIGCFQMRIGPFHLKIVDFINMFLGCHNPFQVYSQSGYQKGMTYI
jgi:hypothetical protein